PVGREPAMAGPTEEAPDDAPAGQGDGRFDLGTLGLGVPRATRIGAVVELADEMDRSVEGEEVTMAMVADIHPAATVGAVAIEDVELPGREVGRLRPEMRHDVALLAITGQPSCRG